MTQTPEASAPSSADGVQPTPRAAATGSVASGSRQAAKHGDGRAHSSGPSSNWILEPRIAFSAEALVQRLSGSVRNWRDDPPSLRLWYWLAPVLTAALAGLLRFVRLGEPNSLVFDETYYVKDAYSYLISGYERNWPEKANDAFNVGNPGLPLETAEYVVHPPVGKWMIAAGMWLFGADNAFGWRFAAALTGTLSVLLVALIAQKLFSSISLGAVAGLLLAVDGHHLVLSRTSLLDIFLMFWVLAAFGALLLDRDDGRRRLADRLAKQGLASPTGLPTHLQLLAGPWLGFRWWRLTAGICLGLAVGTKWSGLFFLAAFGLMTVFWDMSARRVAGISSWFSGTVIKDALAAFVSMVPVAGLVYAASWTGWFRSADAYYRNWAAENPAVQWSWLPDTARSWFHYHLEAYNFHKGLSSDHPYEATAWTWLVMGRPTSFYYQSPEEGTAGCALSNCTSAILSVGNPLIWWPAAVALVVLLFWWAGRRDWRAGAILAGVAAGYLPWFMYPERTTFFFYAISFEPFLILALTYCVGLVLGTQDSPDWRRRSGLYLVCIYLAAVLLVSAFFHPVWTAEIISYTDWRLRIWMPSWI